MTTASIREPRLQTALVRGGQLRSAFAETSEALYLTSGYTYPTAEEAEAAFKGENDRYVYSRYRNPTVGMFEERLRLLEGAEACRATTSGMAAVQAALLCQLQAGDRIVASRALFGSCLYIVKDLLPRYGVETILVDGPDLNQWENALRPTDGKTPVCAFLETPSNPTLEIVDLEAVCDLAHAVGAQVVVDNVFASPLLQRPFAFGADVVVYSATKHIDGQGRCLGGAILASQRFVDDLLTPIMRHTGPALSPFNAWVLLKGLETLSLRIDRQNANAGSLANFLGARNGVAKVLYPLRPDHPQYDLARRQMSGGGSVVTFEVDGGKQCAFKILNALRIIDISNNLGDAKSLITHPATTTHQRLTPDERCLLGISEGLLRLSVGLEDVEDLKDDLSRALTA